MTQAPSPSASPARGPRNVLVISTVDHPEEALRAHLSADDSLKVVVPVVSQGVLDWLANDEKAVSHAKHSAETTAAELPGDAVEAIAGEADVELAIRDALATFPADEIVIAVRPADQQGVVESGATDHLPAGTFDGIPVRRIVIREPALPEQPGQPGTAVGVSPTPTRSGVEEESDPARDSPDGAPETARGEPATPTVRGARTPVRALGATVTVIAVAFAVALALAFLAYFLAR